MNETFLPLGAGRKVAARLLLLLDEAADIVAFLLKYLGGD
jgi:hypothetical protein